MDAITLSEQATLERFNAKQDRVARDFGYGDTVGALGITKDCLEPLKVYIQSKIEETLRASNELEVFAVVKSLPVELLALVTLSGALGIIATTGEEIVAAKAIGEGIHGEAWAAGLLQRAPDLAEKVERTVRRRHGNLKYRKQAARSIAARLGYKAERWSTKQTLTVGRIFLDYLLQALPDVFVLEDGERKPDAKPGHRPHKVLSITEGALATAENAVEQALRGSAKFLPAAEELKPWTAWYDGGYWDARSRFRRAVVRTRYKETAAAVKAAMAAGTMQPHVDAINTLQGVAWTINERVLGVLKWAYGNNVPVKGLPPLTNLPMPEKGDDWDKLNEDEQRLWKRKASQTKQYNRSFVSNRMLMKHDLETADLMAEAGRFWTPMNCDWRGRIYSIPHFNFQRDDRVRALFQFAEGKPIGEEGIKWLKVHVANTGDFDKVSKQSLEERLQWTNNNLERIEQTALVPTKELWWTKADKPFLFLAACMELTSALAASIPTAYITHTPVSFDGSCSGLQHLSAMTRDEKTAAMVNLLPGEKPQDVYQTVADAVKTRVAADAGAETTAALANLWLSYGIDRKLVKRNVMTFAYSSKKFGMAQQLMEDLMRPLEFAVLEGKYETHPFGEDGGNAAAKYLAGITYDAITALVSLPAQAMVMLQKTARALAHEGKPVSWTTPLGLPWVNRYHEVSVKRLDMWLHDVRVQLLYGEEGHKPEVDKEKSANGVAPNFVHACDAVHLLMVANASAREDITQLATIHDSFGCLAADASRFRQIIREQFVALYEHNDVLMQVLGQAKHDLTIHNQQRLPEAPAFGTLKLEEVLRADYAFA